MIINPLRVINKSFLFSNKNIYFGNNLKQDTYEKSVTNEVNTVSIDKSSNKFGDIPYIYYRKHIGYTNSIYTEKANLLNIIQQQKNTPYLSEEWLDIENKLTDIRIEEVLHRYEIQNGLKEYYREYYHEYIKYKQALKIHPKTAFVYDPNLTDEEKDKIASKDKDIISYRNFIDKYGHKFLNIMKIDSNYIDLTYTENTEVLDLIQQQENTTYLSEEWLDIENKLTDIRIEKVPQYYKDQLEKYKQALKIHPKTAFVYDPDLTDKEKEKLVSKDENILKLEDFETKYSIPHGLLFTENEGKICIDTCFEKYVDTSFPKNAEFISKFISAEHNFVSLWEIFDFESLGCKYESLSNNYNFSDKEIKSLIKNNNLHTLDFHQFKEGKNFNAIVDASDEIIKNALYNHSKKVPMPSKYHFSKFVPAEYLASLGFGTPFRLFNLVKDGTLKGKVQKINTNDDKKLQLLIDISSSYAREILTILRDKNRFIVTPKELAKNIKVKPEQIDIALENGELEIIPDALFDCEAYINLRIKKNAEFVDKIYMQKEFKRQQIKQEQKAKQSLRMQLVWHFCPKTREVEQQLTYEMPWVVPLFIKEENDKLEGDEYKMLLSFYKEVWRRAGTEEFQVARIKAKEIMDCYEEQGIYGIEDEEIKNIILNMGKQQN